MTAGTNTDANYRNGQPSVIGDIATVAKAVGAAEGEIFTEPTVRRIAERGPERILKLGGYRSSENRRVA